MTWLWFVKFTRWQLQFRHNTCKRLMVDDSSSQNDLNFKLDAAPSDIKTKNKALSKRSNDVEDDTVQGS